jgi:hypothetical protein
MKISTFLSALFFMVFTVNAQEVKIKEISSMGQKKFSKSSKRVYIADFRVNYQLLFSQVEVAEGGREFGGGYRGEAKAGLNLGVKGVSASDIQAITNDIYKSYVAELEKAGYTLITADEAAKTEQYEGYEMKSGGTINENQYAGLLSVVPNDYNYLIKKTTSKGKEKNKFNGYKLSAELEGALVAKFNVNVLFTEDAESGFSKTLGNAVGGLAKIVIRPNLRIASGLGTYNQFYFAETWKKPLAYTKMEIKNDIEIPGVFEDKKYKATNTAQTDLWGSSFGVMTVYNVSDSYLSKTIPVVCESQKYNNGVKQAAIAYIDAIFNKFNNY